jgi:hypothetical protein
MTRLIKSLLLTGTVGVGLLAVGAGTAHAHVLPSLESVTTDGPNFKYTYDVQLDALQRLEDADYFTIYDFAGYVPSSIVAPAGWSASVQLVGVTPSDVLPVDDPGLWNLTWTRTGGEVLTTPTGVDLGDGFTADSTINQTITGTFVGRATRDSGPLALSKISNIGDVQIPGPASETPEPCTLALLGLGAAPLALRRRSRKA